MASKIIYRVVTALIALCAFPAAIFAPIVRVVGEVSITDSYVYEQLSLWDVYSLFFSKDSTFSGFAEGMNLTDGVKETMPALIASGCCLAAALILAVIIACFAAFSNKKLVNVFLSAGAVCAVIAMFLSFNGGFARPFTDGTISVSDLGLIEWGIINSLLDVFVAIKVLQITSAGFLLIIVFAGVLLWTLAFVLTELGEPKKDLQKGMKNKR
jgi:hypothetical protein